MDWYSTVFELIDMRSFSNLWYWIALAVVWSTSSHWVIGVPYDLVLRAGRSEGQAQVDLEDLVRINCNRLIYINEVSGLWILAFACALLTGLGLLGFIYQIEFAQALFLLAFPLSLVALLGQNTAHTIHDRGLDGEALRKLLRRRRLYTQIIGLLAIFITAMWGMYQNMIHSALGS